MEILQKFKRNGYFTAELYHLLAKKKYVESPDEIIPSEYCKEMNKTTTERLQSLHNIYVDNNIGCSKKADSIVLSFSPKVIIFQNYKANEKITAKFSVKNISKAPCFLSMVFKESSTFAIKLCGGQLLSRLAPGISITFAVTFTPAQNEDYTHKVVFDTEHDQYTMPLIAMAPRPVFDFPDRVNIPKVPLKLEMYQNITVRNIGVVPAGFTLASKCPFSVKPRSAFLNAGETVIVRIGLKTMRLGNTHGAVYVLFETGEKFRINVFGLTHTVNVELEKQTMRFSDTYNTLVRHQTFKITNKSTHLLTYMCMKNDCVYNDFEDKVKLATIFYSVKDTESEKYRKLVEYDVLSSEEHERVYTRIFFDEIQALVADETLSFQNMHFSITPVAGKIWPNKSTELTITFSPKEIGEFAVVAYLDIDGVLDRLPLKLVGKSLPPDISLNVETLDMDSVYINKTYNYEVVAVNKGHINGVLVYKEVSSLFGSRITCSPHLHCLKPGDKEIFVISFSNSNQGPYFEEVNFIIRDTNVVLKLYLKGVIIYPSLMFSIPCLDFSIVSLGIPKTLDFDVINESIVDVSACLKISSDGPEISSMTLADYAVVDRPKPGVPQWPREFDIQPSKLYIAPESRVSIKVTLTANLARANQTSLEMELEKSDSPPIILPVKFNALVPEITPAPEIKLRVCFLDHPYKYDVFFSSNDLWGYFTVEDENVKSTLDIEIGVKEGLIEPNSTTCIPIVMKTSVLGTQEYSLQLHLFGCSQPIEICHITGCGVRPIVTCNPMALHWGQVKVATRSLKTLTLFNDSPVFVYFKCSLLNKDGKWQIQPSEGFIEPESETDLTLNLYLVDADTFTNKAVIQMEKVKDIFIPLSATGVGTSILIGDFRDRVMLGRHFTKIPLNCKVTMENCGSRLHTLEWSEHYKQPKTKQQTAAFFNLEPKIFKMTAGEKMDLTITGLSLKVGVVKETWYLVGSIEGINKKELLLECPIVAEFVDPKIELTAPLIDLQYDYGPYNEFYKLTDIVTIKNVSRLPLDMEITVKPPFAMVHKSTTYRVLPEDEDLCGCIYYSESDLNVPRIVSEVGQNQSKLFIDFLTLKAVEPLRKGPLNFFQDINRIKMAFNLTHLVEERLEDQEVMKIQVLFDTTKHSSLKSKVYCELMRIKFKGHKNKDAIKLIGRINYPNLVIHTPKLDFQCIMNASIESRAIKIQNVTPLHVCFKFQWRKCAITKNKTEFLSEPMEKGASFQESLSSPGKTEITAICLHGNMDTTSPDMSEIDKIIMQESRMKETHYAIVSEEEPEISLDDPELERLFMKTKTIRKISPMIEPDFESKFNWTYKFPKVLNYSNISINNILCLTPHRGILKPNEIQSVHVIFRPKENINVRAVLECEVLGGPSESIVVTGLSSDLNYRINPKNVNFKIRPFYEEAWEILRITNTSLLSFEYKTYLNEPIFTNELQGIILDLCPNEKVLESEEEIDIRILVRPGVVGYFDRRFLLEIGHLPHIPIEVFGWGVIPQVYVCTERPGISNWPEIIGYLAIPSLSTEYLQAINEIFMKSSASEHLNSPLTEHCYEDPELQHDWHISSFWDLYPSLMDIELAIERFLVISHLQTRPEILTHYRTGSSMPPIPGFHTTPYVVDFGVVITESTVRTVIDVINYGPVMTKLHMAKGTKIPTWLALKICGKLLPGETGKMEIGFSPTSLDFIDLEQDVETSFNLEVPCGVTIPIVIRALCAVPYLASNVSLVNFGSVRCGEKVVHSIPLKNIGKPTCIWYVTLRLKTPGPNPMMILDCSGKYEPGEGGWLNISFKPIMELHYEGLLIFRFHMNPKKMVIPITGQGISPHVQIIGPSVGFPPTLPWANTTEMYFGLTNPCPFPIELIIAHSDIKWKDEDSVYQLLYKYYNKPEEMLVPVLKPGDSFPTEVVNFFKTFTTRVQKSIAAETAAAAAAMKSATLSAKKSKSPKTTQKVPASSREPTPKKRRTESEIIADEMKAMWEEQIDPLKECQHVFDKKASVSNSNKHNKGILIFFHGSPCEEMQSQELAHSVGKGLGIPTINIDLAIVEALCIVDCDAKDILLSCINELYKAGISATKNLDTNETEKVQAEEIEEEDNDFDSIWKKIEYLGSEKNLTPRSKAGEKKKPKKTSSSTAHNAAVGSTTMFQMDLVQELMTHYFNQPKFHNGFVLESLTSMVLKIPQNTIATVLKCKTSIRNIHMVLCHSDFAKWAAAYEETQREMELMEESTSKVYDETEIEAITCDFEDMNDEEYENSSPELKAIYITYGLEQRRLRYIEKKGPRIKEPVRKDKSGKVIESTLAVASEIKKKAKKEDTKGAKQTSQYIMMNMRYNDYMKNTYENLINIANNWLIEECDVGIPLYGFNGQVLGGSQKKGKKKSDTEVHLQASDGANSERGFPLTMIMCPCLHYKNALVHMFQHLPVVQEALKEDTPFDILKCPFNIKNYTVLLPKTFPIIHEEEPLRWRYLDELPIKKCECNPLTDISLIDDSNQENVLNVLAKWHCTCGKKVASLQTSTSEIPSTSMERITSGIRSDSSSFSPLPVRSVKSVSALPARIVLQSGDLVRCKYTFDPQTEGNYSVKRYVEVAGWPESRTVINVSGICDLPRLDSRPKKMFKNFIRRTTQDVVYKLTFLDDLKLFQFGPIFVGKNRIYEEEYTIELKNVSLITADTVIQFFIEAPVFDIDKDFISLEPACRGQVTVNAAPADVGEHNTILLLCVKDNPEIVTINITCSGVVPNVQILPLSKAIDYGKLLLYRRQDDRFIVKNDSILPIMWKIRNAEEFIEDFVIPHTFGIVPSYDNHVVPVTYIACRVGIISNKPLIIDIYDSLGRGEPMLVDTLFLTAECYDVLMEYAFENPAENFLNYGNVKVNSTVYQDMYLLNRGKYNIYYKIKKVKNFPEPSLLKTMEFTHSGMIPATMKPVAIEFECTPTISMNLVNVPAFTCSLLDGSKNQVVVAKFPICITIASFYNTFTLFPLGELNFHVIAVGTRVMREVILNNTSKCPITYEIILPPQYRIDPNAPPTPVKGGDKKIKNPPLKCGNFLINNDDNLLAPGTSRTIQIQFFATSARKFEETINFIVSDTCPAEAQGVPLRLVGVGAMPTLDFWNLETSFREHLIVRNLSQYKMAEPSPHCIFAEDSVTLHFFCVTVQTSHTATIDLYNNGLVPCALTMKLHYQPNSGPNIFSLDKSDTFIEPLMHKNLGVIFTPRALEEYRAVLEIKLKLLDSQEQSFKICLIGDGVIPRIEMTTPNLKQRKMGILKLPVTCLGSVTNKNIVFKNISLVWSVVLLEILQQPHEERLIFWLSTESYSDHMLTKYDVLNTSMKVIIKPEEVATVQINYNPIRKGRSNCDVKITIVDNPFESYTVFCEAEAFMEDVILTGLQMLSMEVDIDNLRDGTSTVSTIDTNKKSKSATFKKKKDTKEVKKKKSQLSTRTDSPNLEPSLLKYVMDFGGCELGSLQKRSLMMINNSDKVYKFTWQNSDCITIKPSIGYISPGEEKDVEIMFFATQPVVLERETINCTLIAISDDALTMDIKGTTWDNRQCITTFEHNKELSVNERFEDVSEEQVIQPTETNLGVINIVILYSAATQYIKYTCHLPDDKSFRDTFIYQSRSFDFKIKNDGKVAMKIIWSFQIDEEFPTRIDKFNPNKLNDIGEGTVLETNTINEKDESQLTLFSGDLSRDSVDTWFEIDLPFSIEPMKTCLKPNESKTFKVTFAPLEAFDYKIRLKSSIDNLDPYDQNVSCRITAKSLIPYCHLDIEESDYITAGRRKVVGVALPPHTIVLEFNVLGSGCYKKSFNVINPTSEGYEFIFEMVMSEKPELIPVHCDVLKGFVEGGTSIVVTFTFSPTAPGVYESQWKFLIPVNSLVINLLVVGIVKESRVAFIPNILLIRNSLVGFTTTDIVMLRNSENESLEYEFKGNSLCNESGKTPIVIQPERGVLKPNTEAAIKIIYTPIVDGPLSFKIFCAITHLTKFLTLCVNALSYSINPKVTYYLIGNEHILNSEAVTNIHLDQTASTYERRIAFTIKNEGSATFFFDWHYASHPVKRYLQVDIEPRSGHVPPGEEVDCTLHFTLKQVPVEAFPVTLSISDGPEYSIYLYAEIKKPTYRFSCMDYDFGKCIINAPDTTYKKSIAIFNNDKEPITMDLNFSNLPELVVDYEPVEFIEPNKKLKIIIFFRPKQVKEYEFKLQFWVNSLCEENIIIKGEGVPLLFDLYEGCQKSFDLGPVKVGEKIIREIEVMNHSKVPIDATFIFRDMYPVIDDEGTNSDATSVCLSPSAATIPQTNDGLSRVKMLKQYKDDKIKEQIAMDIQNALSSLKVVPNKVKIKPHRKVPLKIHFKPVGMISKLDVQLNMKVLHFERPLVKLSGSATGMSLCLSQSSLQFGRVRKRGCKVMKVMLMNKGDFGTRFWWQPLISDEFTISPGYGDIAARTNVTFTITFRPKNHNPFIKVWASCNIENYIPLELAMYATCMDVGTIQNKTIFIECPVREKYTEYIPVVNPSDDVWLVLSEVTEGPFETLREFNIEPNSTFEIPVKFKPKTIGRHEAQVLYSPLGESALFVTLVGSATHPNPNGNIFFSVAAKEVHTENLLVHNISEKPESYIVSTELIKITPDKFEGYYEIKYAETIRAWGEAAATCRWSYVCFEECEMQLKVMFINEETREYQFYNITVTVLPSAIVDTVCFTSRARESAQRELLIKNPLSEDAQFYVKCEQLKFPDVLHIARSSETPLVMTYSPLVVGVTEEIMEVSNNLSGTYLYKMILKCLPAKEKDLEFTTAFGSSIPIRLRVQNRTDLRTEFTSAVSHPSILTEKKYALGPLDKGKFLVYFEPTKLGVQYCKISFDSPIAGEFVFNIKGRATEPKPQGPYEISVGGFTTILFKNVYDDPMTFKINVDTEDFYVKTFFESIKPKKEVKIAVYMSDRVTRERARLPTGCLTVESYEAADKVQWTYFLHGVP